MSSMTEQEIAARSAATMWERDNASRLAGIRLGEVSAGRATVSLTVEARHTNGHDICHGAYIFMLADTAFAFACNSYNQACVAQQNAITYVAPAQLNDDLTASAVEISRHGRSGVYDATVTNQHNETIALFRGNSRTLGKSLFEEDEQ